MPSTIRLAPSPPTDFSSQGQCGKPQVHSQPRQGSTRALPEHHVHSPRQGGHNKFFRSTFEESRGIATQCTPSYVAAMLCPTQGGREVTLSSDKEASSDVTARCTQEGVKAGNNRRKVRLPGTMTMTRHYDGHD
jgi:hypothetical protein